MAAGVLIAVGAATGSWSIERSYMRREVAVTQAKIDREKSAVTKLEAENNALRNLVVAARNAPAVFPGRESIVSVQDPYMVRDLQRARQTQLAISQALDGERTKASDLEKRLSQTTVLLAAATRDKEDADRQSRKATDASMERERGINQLSQEIDVYKTKVNQWEAELTRSRATIQSQSKIIEQRSQIISLLQSKNAALISLHGSEPSQVANGAALVGDNSRIAFFPGNLPPTATGRAYQLWMILRNGETVSVGTFSLTKDAPPVQFVSKPNKSAIQALAVTEEPAGGSSHPTGIKLLIGSAKGL